MYSYNVIKDKESYPREVYYSQAKRIEELENYIMDENFNPYQDSWTDVNKMKELGITEEQKELFRLQKFEEMEQMRFWKQNWYVILSENQEMKMGTLK